MTALGDSQTVPSASHKLIFFVQTRDFFLLCAYSRRQTLTHRRVEGVIDWQTLE